MSEAHRCKYSYCQRVPAKKQERSHLDFDLLEPDGFRIWRRNLDGSGKAGDLLDGAHEDVGGDGNAEKTPEHAEQIESGSWRRRPCVLADQWKYEAFVGTSVVV